MFPLSAYTCLNVRMVSCTLTLVVLAVALAWIPSSLNFGQRSCGQCKRAPWAANVLDLLDPFVGLVPSEGFRGSSPCVKARHLSSGPHLDVSMQPVVEIWLGRIRAVFAHRQIVRHSFWHPSQCLYLRGPG